MHGIVSRVDRLISTSAGVVGIVVIPPFVCGLATLITITPLPTCVIARPVSYTATASGIPQSSNLQDLKVKNK